MWDRYVHVAKRVRLYGCMGEVFTIVEYGFLPIHTLNHHYSSYNFALILVFVTDHNCSQSDGCLFSYIWEHIYVRPEKVVSSNLFCLTDSWTALHIQPCRTKVGSWMRWVSDEYTYNSST